MWKAVKVDLVFSFQCSVFSFQFSVFSVQCSVFSVQCSGARREVGVRVQSVVTRSIPLQLTRVLGWKQPAEH